jgi:hypothetical protein
MLPDSCQPPAIRDNRPLPFNKDKSHTPFWDRLRGALERLLDERGTDMIERLRGNSATP